MSYAFSLDLHSYGNRLDGAACGKCCVLVSFVLGQSVIESRQPFGYPSRLSVVACDSLEFGLQG
eukprot:2410324-Amphidinium_carterae.1